MRRWALAAMLCLFAFDAAAARMRDMSLPLDQSTGNQPGSITSGYTGTREDPYGAVSPNGPPLPGGEMPAQSGRFMDMYCDPNRKPMLAANAKVNALQSCLEAQKKQSCGQFARLPADVQKLLDEQMRCLFNAAESAQPDSCSGFDAARLQLLKRYWNDQATARAIVFMADEVTGAGACIPGVQ